jgi:hypothetical protein
MSATVGSARGPTVGGSIKQSVELKVEIHHLAGQVLNSIAQLANVAFGRQIGQVEEDFEVTVEKSAIVAQSLTCVLETPAQAAVSFELVEQSRERLLAKPSQTRSKCVIGCACHLSGNFTTLLL